ncbi:hypothetical protein Moror_11940 [Moniliophthora roreri MCA 2997]|uniref:Uncharacterized protein n=1 Tax=Moniliophthora roreri (strain MCA 2997) TaxID=1381753 RepID=V2Y5X6_MONRO|nr:hypothetical protein Moror_11940 [Moniliophthora roreri MCA 2997]
MFTLPSFFSTRAQTPRGSEPTLIPSTTTIPTRKLSVPAGGDPSLFKRLSIRQTLYDCDAEDSENSEPETLAEGYFKHGFFFPLLWIFGAIVLISPLKEPAVDPESHPDSVWAYSSPEERSMRLQRMREAEVKWGKRCLWALLGLLLIVVIAVTVGLGISLRH